MECNPPKYDAKPTFRSPEKKFDVDRFVAVDVEIASKSPMQICAFGAVRMDRGLETNAFRSLVYSPGRIRFGQIHGLTKEDLAHAPEWPLVWNVFLDFLGEIRSLVAFRADFDRAAILTECARHGLRIPRLAFHCAAEMIEARTHQRFDLFSALQAIGVPFPGRPHDPLADARAAAAIALACDRARV